MRHYVIPCSLFGCLLLFTGTAWADHQAAVESLLSFPLLDPQTVQSEVETFCEKRVPLMPPRMERDAWKAQTSAWRKQLFQRCIFRGQANRWRTLPAAVVWSDELAGGPGYRIKKLRYQVLPGMWVPALLYEPTKLSGRVPVFMNVNGHDREHGKANPHKQLRCINQAKRGMLVLNVEWLGMGQLHAPGMGHYQMNQLDLCGTSGIAPFYLTMERGLDILLSHEHADPQRVGVAGLSGGGWQTIFISALDQRVTLANPVAGYSSFITRIHHHSDLGDSEQTPCDMATVADYTHLTAMLAPRPTLLTFNVADQCCFASGHALQPLVDAASPAFRLYGQPASLATHVNHLPGTHNYEQDNREALYRMIGQHFYTGDTDYDPREIVSKKELKTKQDLTVPLPPDNATFQTVATRLAVELPRDRLPAKASRDWITTARSKLKALVKYHPYEAQAQVLPPIQIGPVTGKLWKFQLQSTWTVPAIELTFAGKKPQKTSVVVAEKGRQTTSKTVLKLLDQGHRVIAVDPFYIGESQIPQRDFLFALLVGAVGERPVGIQASQLAAITRWCHARYPGEAIEIIAHGERLCLSALIAAGLEEQVSRLELHGCLSSLKQVMAKHYGVNQAPELFCFGLLEAFDIRELAAIVAPREVRFADADAAMQATAEPLRAWYRDLGKDFSPLP